MKEHRRNSYDDISFHDRHSENGRMHRVVRVLLSLLMVGLVLGSAAFLVVYFRSDGRDDPASAPGEPSLEVGQEEAVQAVMQALEEQTPEKQAETAEQEQEEPPETLQEQEEPSPEGVQYRIHVLQSGESIEDIAGQYGLDPRTLVSVNQIASSGEISEGMDLRIPDSDGKIYTIRAGDSLSRIAHAHGMGYVTLAHANGMDPNAVIHPGRTLFIPRITMSTQEYQRIMGTLAAAPVSSSITTPFGQKRNPITQEVEFPGVEYRLPIGTPVRAAIAGTVSAVFDEPDGLGKYVTLDHQDGYETVYGHLDRVSVTQDQQVDQGAVIGNSGSTGMTLEPVLYFSISRNGVPLDPAELF